MIEKATRLNDVGEYYFSKKLEEVRKMRASGLAVINLGIGSPDMAPSAATVEAAVTAIGDPKNHGYAISRGTPEFRRAIAAWYKKTYAVDLSGDTQVLPLLGSKEGILFISLAFLNPGDGVLIPNPGYPAYGNVAKLIGAKPLFYDVTEESGWLPDLKKMESGGLKGVKLMWVNYPHMPTGKPGNAKVFTELIAFARRHGILLVNDNPYSLVLNPEPLSLLSFDEKLENALELNSFSKAFNMAGWRVGMALGHETYINAILQVKSNVDSGMFLPTQLAATKALENSDAWHKKRNDEYAQRRGYVFQIFDHLGFTYDPQQVGMFAWAKAPAGVRKVDVFLDKILHGAHVFITPGFIFGSNGERFARISLCASVETLRESLKRVKSRNWEKEWA